MDIHQPEATLSLTPPRPTFNRQRSNSVPLTEPLQCTATEAAIMFAAERAVLSRRRAPSEDAATERRRPLSARDPRRNQQDNIRHSRRRPLSKDTHRDISSGEESDSDDIENDTDHRQRQAPRRPNTSTIKENINSNSAPATTTLGRSNTSPTAMYSAGLAKFIQGRLVSLNSPPGGQPIPNPRSCPNFSQVPRKSRSQPDERRHIDNSGFIRRPVLRSSFSAWSTPGDSSAFEEDEDDMPVTSDTEKPKQYGLAKTSTNTSTPSILDFYQTSAAGSSFLLPDTPVDQDGQEEEADGYLSSPAPSTIKHCPISRSASTCTTSTHASSNQAGESQPRHTPGPASTFNLSIPEKRKSYFAAAPRPFKTLMAISPYEGQALTRVYDMQVHGSKRIVTEGMAFEMFNDLKMPARHSMAMATPI
ncbi:hypothetical protein BU16DRAFT_268402 [Lophium mytilinum]|uniref:Uncharacterized protein n=1 Tax=Lophium mytilinum TaxID=390894 RepID=A0A6A6R6J3_9PEZI|nr:hypothetical protein BU16DRAFT_268402 [Lophium mytilinum]